MLSMIISMFIFILVMISSIIFSSSLVIAAIDETDENITNTVLCTIEINNKEQQHCKFNDISDNCTFAVNTTITKFNTTKYAFYYYIADINNKVIKKKQTIHIRGKNIVVSHQLNISITWDDIKKNKAAQSQSSFTFVISGCGITVLLPIIIDTEALRAKITKDEVASNPITEKSKTKNEPAIKKLTDKDKDNVQQFLPQNNPKEKLSAKNISTKKITEPEKKQKLSVIIDNNPSNPAENYIKPTDSSIDKKDIDLQIQNNTIIYQSKTKKISAVIPYILILFVIIIAVVFFSYYKKQLPF